MHISRPIGVNSIIIDIDIIVIIILVITTITVLIKDLFLSEIRWNGSST